MNLLKETMHVLAVHGKTIDDITHIFGDDFQITKENFVEVASRTEYDAGYGLEEIPLDLIVAGEDFWLERYEYDGSECWEYKELPTPPTRVERIEILSRGDSNNYFGVINSISGLNAIGGDPE